MFSFRSCKRKSSVLPFTYVIKHTRGTPFHIFFIIVPFVCAVPFNEHGLRQRDFQFHPLPARNWRHVLHLSSFSTPVSNPSALRPFTEYSHGSQNLHSRFTEDDFRRPIRTHKYSHLRPLPNKIGDHENPVPYDDEHAFSWVDFLTDDSSQNHRHLRRSLAEAASKDDVKGVSVPELRTRISEHRVRLSRIKQELKDVAHEKGFLEKALELKKGQRTMQDGQVKLSQAELIDKEREIAMYKREAPRTLQRYNDLVRKQRDLQETLNRLHQQSENLLSSKRVIMDKIQNLNVEDLIERHARGLPDSMAGALRKSATILTPFFNYLVIAADTNDRLVGKVGTQIDKYTHVNISGSPFMSGILYYCVLLIPLLTLSAFIRRVLDTSSKLTVSHYLILGNAYFVVMCGINTLIAQFIEYDPMEVYFLKFERTFILANLFLAIYYIWHIAMLSLQAALTLERRIAAQLIATLAVGMHYFIFTWRNIFTDRPPVMFTFNYLMYATIFAIIIHDRYQKLTPAQLHDVPLFHSIHILLNPNDGKGGRTVSGTLFGMLSVLWRFCMPTSSPRRFPRRLYRPSTPERQSRYIRSAETERLLRTRSKPAYSSSNDSITTESEDISPVSHRHRAVKAARPISNQKQPKRIQGKSRRSIWEFLFPARKVATPSSESDNEPQSSNWRMGSKPDENSRGTRAQRSTHRLRDKKDGQKYRPFWKWS